VTAINDMPGEHRRPERGGGIFANLDSLLRRAGYYIAILAAWIATLGSLYFSEIASFIPCKLCWYQRIAMYPLALLIPVGLIARDRGLPRYVFSLTGVGLVLAFYHILIENYIILESIACDKAAPCTARWINWYGFITIPTLAFAAFIIVTLAVSASRRAPEWADSASQSRPWRGVLASIALAVLFMTYVLVVDGR